MTGNRRVFVWVLSSLAVLSISVAGCKSRALGKIITPDRRQACVAENLGQRVTAKGFVILNDGMCYGACMGEMLETSAFGTYKAGSSINVFIETKRPITVETVQVPNDMGLDGGSGRRRLRSFKTHDGKSVDGHLEILLSGVLKKDETSAKDGPYCSLMVDRIDDPRAPTPPK